MAVRKFRTSWWVDFSVRGHRYRIKSPGKSVAAARAFEATLRQRLAHGEKIDQVDAPRKEKIIFAEFAWQWFDEYVVPNNKLSEQRTKRTVLRSSLVPFFGKVPVEKITGRQVEQYKAQALGHGTSRKTINNRLSVFRKCLWTAYEWLALPGAPPAIRWLKCAPTIADYLSPDECSLLLSRARDTTHEMILTALRTGMRQGELRGLQWSSIDWQNRSITVQHSRCDFAKELTSPKNYRARHIPMDIDVFELLLKRKKSTGYVFLNEKKKPFDSQSLKHRLTRVRCKAGLRRIGWHTLRHTFASHLAMRGVPMTAIQMLMGHSSITTTMRYAHLAPSTLRAAVDILNPKSALNADFGQPAGNAWLEEQRRQIAEKSHPQNIEHYRPKLAA